MSLHKVSPNIRRTISGWVALLSVIGWPLSAFTFAADEPQFVLGLSWLAITLTALDVYFTTDVRVEQEKGTQP